MDRAGRLRMDQNELDDSVQNKVKALWAEVTSDNLRQLSDFAGYHSDFLKLFGFGFNNVDYEADISPMIEL